MKKSELQKIWNQLDEACEALEKLTNEEGIIRDFSIFFEIVCIKEKVEILMNQK
jgi:hypothetical protein